MKDKLLLSAALILCNYQSYSLDHQSRYLQEEGLEASNSTQATEVEQDTPAEEQPVDEQEGAESTEAPEDEQEAVEEEGTDADFPVETDEEREDRLARERVEEDEAVQRDYQSVYDQSEDFDPEAIDSEYGLDNYYQSGENDFADEYEEEVQAEINELEMYGAVSKT